MARGKRAGADHFTDVKEGSFSCKAILWANENGITKGTSATAFSPKETCTREQIVTFLWRYENEPAPKTTDNPFKDVKEGGYAFDAILWAAENGITTGVKADLFAPKETCTRAQVVTFLFRAVAE